MEVADKVALEMYIAVSVKKLGDIDIVVAVSSVSGGEVDFTGHAYGAFKAELVHYTQSMANKHAGRPIRFFGFARQHLF